MSPMHIGQCAEDSHQQNNFYDIICVIIGASTDVMAPLFTTVSDHWGVWVILSSLIPQVWKTCCCLKLLVLLASLHAMRAHIGDAKNFNCCVYASENKAFCLNKSTFKTPDAVDQLVSRLIEAVWGHLKQSITHLAPGFGQEAKFLHWTSVLLFKVKVEMSSAVDV